MYRAGIQKERSLAWYISITALLLSVIISFRQRVYIEDFAPFVVISIPLMLKTFLHSYRVRLKEFRKIYNILAILIIGMLSLNVIFTFVNKPLYILLPNQTKHFVYQYHFIKELSKELKSRNIDNLIGDNELLLRLKFYGINQGEDYYISMKDFYNYDEKITIKYYERELFVVYIKKLK